MKSIEYKAIWALAALEGFGVMVLESMCAKYLAPVYGDTLQVWSSAVGMTLVGLCMGYFLGSALATRRSHWVWGLVLSAATLMVLTPFIAQALIPKLISGDLFRDSLAVSAVLLLPPLALVGATPGLLVARLSMDGKAGQVAGKVFTVSTVGSICGIFLTGFVLVPAIGITLPLIFAGMLLAVVPAWMFARQRKAWGAVPVLASVFAFWQYQAHGFPETASLKVHYYQEGILGQVMVGDFGYTNPEGQARMGRALYVNRMPQTLIDLQSGEALFSPYIDFMDFATSPIPKGDVLLLGLGGGSLVRRFRQAGRNVDVCELDARVVHAAKTYFRQGADDAGERYHIDDARHYLRTSTKQYDHIIFDIFKGESPPHHAFTVEAFEDAAKILKPGGAVVVNFLGRTTGPRSLGPRAVIHTLLEAKYAVKVIAIPNIDNVIVLGAQQAPVVDARLMRFVVPVASLNLSESPVLRDDTPMLELLHAETAAWNRAWYNKNYTLRFLKENIPMFR